MRRPVLAALVWTIYSAKTWLGVSISTLVGVVSRRIPHGIPRSCVAHAGAASTTAETASRSFYSAAAVATWVARLPGRHPTEADERGLPTARNDGSSPKNRPGLLSTTNATNIRLPHAEHNGGFIFSGVVMHPSKSEALGRRIGKFIRECREFMTDYRAHVNALCVRLNKIVWLPPIEIRPLEIRKHKDDN